MDQEILLTRNAALLQLLFYFLNEIFNLIIICNSHPVYEAWKASKSNKSLFCDIQAWILGSNFICFSKTNQLQNKKKI